MALAPLKCSMEGCDFSTPANTPTWELIRDFLQMHTSSEHKAAPAGAHQEQAVRPKPAPVTRPEIDLGVSEELWHCQTRALRTLMLAEDSSTLTTEETLLAKIKSLAAVTLHSAVHLVQLRSVQQRQNESIRKFVARAKNIASSCNLQTLLQLSDKCQLPRQDCFWSCPSRTQRF